MRGNYSCLGRVIILKLNDITKFEKANMNKIRYTMNYRIVPLYLLAVVSCIVIVGILMTVDESRYTPVAIGLFALIGILTLAFVSSVPFVRKREILAEMKRYDFHTGGVEPRDVYDFSDEEVSLRFDPNGMYVNDTFFWYNHLNIFINTSNYLNRVWISIVFLVSESDYYELLLNGETISMIERFNIHLGNRQTLDYLVHHKEEAFIKIYKTGHV